MLLVCCWPHSDRADHHGQHGGLADCGLRSAVTHRKLAALLWHRVNHRHAPLEEGVLLLAVRGRGDNQVTWSMGVLLLAVRSYGGAKGW